TIFRMLAEDATRARNVAGVQTCAPPILPRNARPSVGGGGATAKPPASTTVCPSGFVTVTSRAPIAAVAPITRATESWVDETTVEIGRASCRERVEIAAGGRVVQGTGTAR